MEFRVELSRRAMADMEDIFNRIEADAPMNAIRWRRGLQDQIRRLTYMATSFPLAEENRDAPCEVRQTLFGRYRILYTVQEDVAFVLTIRHGHRLPMSGRELRQIGRSE